MDTGFVKNFVNKIIRENGTRDPFEIAEKNGVSIIYESWYPTAIGEFERKTKTIRVNLRALGSEKNGEKLKKTVVAHELGHFFAKDFGFDRSEEEQFAREFAENLLEK